MNNEYWRRGRVEGRGGGLKPALLVGFSLVGWIVAGMGGLRGISVCMGGEVALWVREV